MNYLPMTEVSRRLKAVAKAIHMAFAPSFGFVLLLTPLQDNLEGKSTLTTNISDPNQVKMVLKDAMEKHANPVAKGSLPG